MQRGRLLWAGGGVFGVFVACSPAPSPGGTADAGDAGRDAKVTVVDGGDAGPICAPGPIGNFTSSWVPPKPASSACTEKLIGDYAAACLDAKTRSGTACTAFGKANAACTSCLVTQEGSSAYGAAILRPNGVISLNVGGCIALVSGDVSANGCGAKYETNRQCAAASCDANCPLPDGDDAAFSAYLKCLSDSSKSTCSTQAAAVCPEADAGALTACQLGGATFVDNFLALAPIFCASGG